MKKYFFLIISCLFYILYSCVDKLELEPIASTEKGITIQGELIYGTPTILNIHINQLYNFDVQSYAPISVKSVTIFDEDKNSINVPLRTSRLYQYTFKEGDLIQIVEGAAYQIEIVMGDGTRIISTYEELPPAPKGDVELNFEVQEASIQDIKGEIKKVPVVQFSATTPIIISNKNTRYLWTTERTYKITDGLDLDGFDPKTCYVTVNLDFDRLHLLNGSVLTSDIVTGFPLSRVLLNYEFAEGYYYTTYRKSLSEGSFNYYSKIKEVVERTGNLFDTPVGLLPSNLSNADDKMDTNIYGYFTAYQQDTFRIYVAPEDVGNPLLFCPPKGFPCPHVCCDCLFPEGSQLEKPDFWEE